MLIINNAKSVEFGVPLGYLRISQRIKTSPSFVPSKTATQMVGGRFVEGSQGAGLLLQLRDDAVQHFQHLRHFGFAHVQRGHEAQQVGARGVEQQALRG